MDYLVRDVLDKLHEQISGKLTDPYGRSKEVSIHELVLLAPIARDYAAAEEMYARLLAPKSGESEKTADDTLTETPHEPA